MAAISDAARGKPRLLICVRKTFYTTSIAQRRSGTVRRHRPVCSQFLDLSLLWISSGEWFPKKSVVLRLEGVLI
jgi:hypothetical protein